jgi:hypothetical protein
MRTADCPSPGPKARAPRPRQGDIRWRCDKCGYSTAQPPRVPDVSHLCPKDNVLRALKRVGVVGEPSG